MKQKIVIIGSGNVAETLAKTFSKLANYELIQIFGRNVARLQTISSITGVNYATESSDLAVADIYIISVSDKAISEVAKNLDFRNAVVAHTAGSSDIDELPENIVNRGVFYPLQTFTKGREVDMSSVPLFIEGKTKYAAETLKNLAQTVSGNVYEYGSEKRIKLHLAAVFACNFTNHMYAIAENILQESDIPVEVIKPLIAETASKAIDAPKAEYVQTGPAVRNDKNTMDKHIELLASAPELQILYSNISSSIWEISKKTLQKSK